MPSILCGNPSCPRQGVPFHAKTRRNLYCSDACKTAALRVRAIGSDPGRRIADPKGTVAKLQERFAGPPSLSRDDFVWVRVNDVTWNYVWRDKPKAPPLAQVIDRGPHWTSNARTRWAAVCGELIITATDMEAGGVADLADLTAAKDVAEAWVTGDFAPLVVKSLGRDDVTEDAWLQLRGLLSLIGRSRRGLPPDVFMTDAEAQEARKSAIAVPYR